jgi:hypothetical protein
VAARLFGLPPTGMVAVTLPETASMRDTVPSPEFIRITEFANGTRQVLNRRTFYWTANRMSVAEHVSYSYVTGADESTTYHGTVFNLVVPGAGPVLKEAGLVVFDKDGNVVRMEGLHQVLEGTDNLSALCDFLDA